MFSWSHIISAPESKPKKLNAHQFEYRHFHHTLVEVSRPVLDDLDGHHLLCLEVLAFDDLPEGALAEHIEKRYEGRPMTVVAPDSGRVRVAERWTDRLGGCPLAFIHKTRDPMKPNQVVANRVVGEVEGRV